MGLIRKTMSMSTGGLIDFRSDKERIARSTRQAKNEAKKQTALLKQQNRIQQLTAAAAAASSQPVMPAPVAYQPPTPALPPAPAVQGPPPGWYEDNQDPTMLRWFDGSVWTEFRQPKNAPSPPQA